MARPLRIQYPNAFYHVMNRGNNRGRIFYGDKDMDLFLKVLSNTTKSFGINVLAYCLMHNHYHLLIQTPRGNLSKAMQYIGGAYTTKLNASRRRDGHLFRGRYKSILVEEEEYLRNLIRYIHLNPIKAKLAKDPYSWSYSSHKQLLDSFSKKEVNQSTISIDYVKQLFSNDAKTYVEFHQAGVDDLTEEFFSQKKLPAIFGSEDFIDHIKEITNPIDKEVDFYKEYKQDQLVPHILDNVCLTFSSTHNDLCNVKKGRYNFARSIAALLLKELTNSTHQEIATLLKQSSSNAIRTAIFRLNQNFKDRQDIFEVYKSLRIACSHVTT